MRLDGLRPAEGPRQGETGGAAALPIWINYMAKALGCAGIVPSVPEGMVSKEVVGAKGPAKSTSTRSTRPEEVPEQQAGDADSKPVDQASGTGSPACSEASRAFDEQILAVPRIAPRAAIVAKVKTARPGRDPYFAGNGVFIDDDLAAIGKFDFEHPASGQFEIQIGPLASSACSMRASILSASAANSVSFIRATIPIF